MGEIPIPANEAQIHGHPISPHISHFAQTLRDQSDASRVAQIVSNEKAQQNSLSKQRENYELAHQYMLEQNGRTGGRVQTRTAGGPRSLMAKGDKKFSKTVKNPKTGKKKTVRYGAKGYSIAPGTSKGDSYCARSYGQMKKHPKAAKNPNSPLRLSRAKWKCSGKKSRRA